MYEMFITDKSTEAAVFRLLRKEISERARCTPRCARVLVIA